MRWVLLGAGVGVALFCGAGVASADSRADTETSASGAVRTGDAQRARQVPRGAATAVIPRATADRSAPVPPRRVSVSLPQLPASSGRSFAVSTTAVSADAEAYVADSGDPSDAPRFFFGDLAVRSLERLADPAVTAEGVRADLGNLAVSGYFGGVWLRDSLRTTGPAPAPQAESAPADLTVSALGIALFDTLAAGLTRTATSHPWIATTVAHTTVPVLLTLYGYNRGYLEFLLENPPAGVPSMRDRLSCTGFLDCSSNAVAADLATRYDGALAALANPTGLGWWEMKAWSAVLESVTGAGRFVWQNIIGQNGFPPASYAALVDLSSAYLMISKAAVLSAMIAAADGDADVAAASLRLQAGLWMWSGSYFGGLASGAPAGTIPSITVESGG